MTEVVERTAPIVVGRYVLWVDSNRLVVVFNGSLELTKGAIRIAPVVVCFGELGILAYRFVKVFYGALDLAQSGINLAPIIVGRRISRVDVDGLIIVLYGTLVLT